MHGRRLRAVRRHLAAAQAVAAVELPGRLGDPSLFIHTDPRTDPRIAAQMVAEGITAAADVDTSQFTTNAERARLVNEFELASAVRKEDNPRGAGGVPADVEAKTVSTELTIGGVDGNEIRLVMKRPVGSESTPLPCYYHTHGGGMCMMGVDDPSFVALYTTLAAEGVCVIGVEFRNSAGGLVYGPDAPLAPFPAGINDCMSGLQYCFDHKEELAITTIVVSGESGGGNLSSALALKAKRENRGPLIDGVCKRSRSLCVFFRSFFYKWLRRRDVPLYLGHVSPSAAGAPVRDGERRLPRRDLQRGRAADGGCLHGGWD